MCLKSYNLYDEIETGKAGKKICYGQCWTQYWTDSNLHWAKQCQDAMFKY